MIPHTECTCPKIPGGICRTYVRTGVCAECMGLITQARQESALDVQAGGDHYKNRAIQPFHFVRRNNIPHAEGECIYKLLRWREKGGIADLEKVIHTVQLIIEEERNHGNGLVQAGKQ